MADSLHPLCPLTVFVLHGRDHAAGRSYRIFRYNTFHHIGHISTLAQPTNRYNPGCYALLYDWLLPAEVFNEKQCPDDDLWPCTEANAHAPAFFPPGKLVWSTQAWKATALDAIKSSVVGPLPTVPQLPEVSRSDVVRTTTRAAVSGEGGGGGGGGGGGTIVGMRGESCARACSRVRPSSRCDVAGLSALNSCEVLRGHFAGCANGCEDSIGTDQPALVALDAPSESLPGACLVNSGELSCEGAHPLTTRICACEG